MSETRIDELLGALAADAVRNCSLLQFVRDNPVLGVERAGDAVLVRGRSDQDWIYAAGSDPEELAALAARLGAGDLYFAAIEEWMVPILRRGRQVAWRLPMVRFLLPAAAPLPPLDGEVSPLTPADAEEVFRHSAYAAYLSLEYTRSRILGGPSAAVREAGAPVAWAMTQDDGALGFLQVVERCRHRGYGRRVTVALAARVRELGRTPFAYIAEDNAAAISLVSRLGFARDRKVEWFKLQ